MLRILDGFKEKPAALTFAAILPKGTPVQRVVGTPTAGVAATGEPLGLATLEVKNLTINTDAPALALGKPKDYAWLEEENTIRTGGGNIVISGAHVASGIGPTILSAATPAGTEVAVKGGQFFVAVAADIVKGKLDYYDSNLSEYHIAYNDVGTIKA